MSKNIDTDAVLSVKRGGTSSGLTSGNFETDVSLEGELDVTDYVQDVPLTDETIRDIGLWAEKHRELTRTKLVTSLVNLFGCSLLCTFLLIGAATFNTDTDQSLLKDLAPQLITGQITLIGVALGFYFNTKER